MSVPTHGPDCETRTWRTTCPDCQRPVWFLSCTCGSKVLFDNKGYPWRLHSESCPVYSVRQQLDEGVSVLEIRSLVESRARETRQQVPAVIDHLLRDLGAPGKKNYVHVLPDPVPVFIHGVVKQANPVNIFKKYQVSDNPINRKILGCFAEHKYLEVMVEEITDTDQLNIRRWSFLIPCRELNGCGFKAGLVIDVELITAEIYDESVAWVAGQIDWE